MTTLKLQIKNPEECTWASIFQSPISILSINNPPGFFSIRIFDVESVNSFNFLYK